MLLQRVVMNDGQIVQTGTPVELFDRPNHTFVGHFIGSPGMNVLPCEVAGGRARFAGHPVDSVNAAACRGDGGFELGIRPEFVQFAADGIPVRIVKVLDAGRHRIVEARHGDHRIRMLVPEGVPVPEGGARVRFAPERTWIYEDGWLVAGGEASR